MNTLLLLVTTIFSGLMAGLFYAWSISVTPGIAQIQDESYLQAFQAMNRAILNPAFFLPFFGLVFLLPWLAYRTYQSTGNQLFAYILGAAVLYLVGVILVTVFGNIPLNNALESLAIESMSVEQMANFRIGFERKWNTFNWVRTVCSLLSFALLIYSCIQNTSH